MLYCTTSRFGEQDQLFIPNTISNLTSVNTQISHITYSTVSNEKQCQHRTSTEMGHVRSGLINCEKTIFQDQIIPSMTKQI